MSQADLLDVNVWVALVDANHNHHKLARQYWDKQSLPKIAFSRFTLTGMTRLLISPAPMRNKPFTPSEAWSAYQSIRALPEVIWISEGNETALQVDAQLAKWIANNKITPRLWTDAYLASLAITNDCRLVSFDSDFLAFKELSFLDLRKT